MGKDPTPQDLLPAQGPPNSFLMVSTAETSFPLSVEWQEEQWGGHLQVQSAHLSPKAHGTEGSLAHTPQCTSALAT